MSVSYHIYLTLYTTTEIIFRIFPTKTIEIDHSLPITRHQQGLIVRMQPREERIRKWDAIWLS